MEKRTNTAALTIAKKREAPSTAFKSGNRYRFVAGEGSPNPTGKAKNDLRLVSKSLREQLGYRAPLEVTKPLGLPTGSSWAQCAAASILRSAVGGDMQAARLLVETVEGRAPQSLALSGADGEPLFPRMQDRPVLHVHFVESNGDGRLPADYIEGETHNA